MQLFAKTFWTHCEYSLESLNFVAFLEPNKHKTRSKGFTKSFRSSHLLSRNLAKTRQLLIYGNFASVQRSAD